MLLFPDVVPVSRASPEVQALAKTLFAKHDHLNAWSTRNECTECFYHQETRQLWFRPSNTFHAIPPLEQSLQALSAMNVDAADCFEKASPFEALHLQPVDVDAWSSTRWRRRSTSDQADAAPGAVRLRVYTEPSRPVSAQLHCAIGLAMAI